MLEVLWAAANTTMCPWMRLVSAWSYCSVQHRSESVVNYGCLYLKWAGLPNCQIWTEPCREKLKGAVVNNVTSAGTVMPLS